MFEEQQQSPSGAAPAAARGVEDIFSATEAPQPQGASAPVAPVAGPPSALSQGKLQVAQPAGPAQPPAEQTTQHNRGGIRRAVVLILIGVIIFGGGAAAYVWVVPTLTRDAAPQTQQNTAPTPTATSAPEAAPVSPAPTRTEALDNFQQGAIDKVLDPFGASKKTVDTDQDGLSDEQEFQLGTNPRLVDSDDDGLSDWEEQNIFLTDPLDRDTDDDAYLDGEEVMNGYNPRGSGKLLDFDAARSAPTQ